MMRFRKLLRKLFLFLLTLPVFFFIFFPILWLFSASLSTRRNCMPFPPIGSRSTRPCRIIWISSSPARPPSSVPRTFAVALLNSFKIASA